MTSPMIRQIEWIPASAVLAHEERDFTVWLADNLELLGEALGLEDLRLVARESRVGTFRADILAAADDGSDDGLPVVIENRYGRTNHDHLGKLITYLAASQRGLGVWVVEDVAETHRAAVDFLNRTSDESVGYAIVVVRFAPGPDGGHYVDLDVVSEPNLWVKASSPTSAQVGGTPERREFLEQVAERAAPLLLEAGWAGARFVGGASPKIQLRLAPPHPMAGRVSRTVLRANPKRYTFRHALRLDSYDRSWQAVEGLRERYADSLERGLGDEAMVRWHALEGRTGATNDQLWIEHPAGGYSDVDVAEGARWAAKVCGLWLDLTRDAPSELFARPAEVD